MVDLETWDFNRWALDVWQEPSDKYYLEKGFEKAIQLAEEFCIQKGFNIVSNKDPQMQASIELLYFLKSKLP